MNRKLKKALRERQSTRQLMGIDRLTSHGVKTAGGELAFFLVQPENLSVLSAEGVRGRVKALTDLLSTVDEVRVLALDSHESFQQNKDWYRRRIKEEEIPALRELLRQDMAHLDEIQLTTASAREFAFVFRMDRDGGDVANRLTSLEKTLGALGFRVRLADEQDVKRLLAVYYCQDVTTEHFDNFDGERWVKERYG